MYIKIRKSNGKECELPSLRSLRNNNDRYLCKKEYHFGWYNTALTAKNASENY